MDIEKLCARLEQNDFSSVAVVGDVCLDSFFFVDGPPTQAGGGTRRTQFLSGESHRLALASEIAENCKTLGVGNVDLYGVAGNDCMGAALLDLLRRKGLDDRNIVIQDSAWTTFARHRIIANNQEVGSLVAGGGNVLLEGTADRLIQMISSKIDSYECVVVKERFPTSGGRYLADRLDRLAESHPSVVWLVDSWSRPDLCGNSVCVMTREQALKLCGDINGSGPKEIDQAGLRLAAMWGRPVVVFLSDEGARIFEGGRVCQANGIASCASASSAPDGDTSPFVAGIAKGLASRLDIRTSVQVGNLNAHIRASGPYGGPCPTLAQLKSRSGEIYYRYNTGILDRPPVFFGDTDIELINDWRKQDLPEYAIFDHDGSISVLRQGWETAMESTMMKHLLLGNDIDGKREADLREKVRHLIEISTGIQTIIQMKYYVELIKKENLLNPCNDKSPQEFKEIYASELDKSIRHKLDNFKKGILDTADLTIKGSLDFLRILSDHGTQLYLASGTDTGDVVEEASLLGYAKYFNGNIFGSVGDIKNDPKKIVMQEIIRKLKASGAESQKCVVFGDGPVEMQEAKKNNFRAVGIISDEKQRFGRNPAKRSRLILAGADILIPDFSEIGAVFNMEGENGQKTF